MPPAEHAITACAGGWAMVPCTRYMHRYRLYHKSGMGHVYWPTPAMHACSPCAVHWPCDGLHGCPQSWSLALTDLVIGAGKRFKCMRISITITIRHDNPASSNSLAANHRPHRAFSMQRLCLHPTAMRLLCTCWTVDDFIKQRLFSVRKEHQRALNQQCGSFGASNNKF